VRIAQDFSRGGLSGSRERRDARKKVEKTVFSSAFFPAKRVPITGEGKNPADPLKARFLNVTYPSYQAAEAFGRRKRRVSSTDRSSGAFEKNLLESFLPVSFPWRFA
jgi:hypothetical protein